VVLPETKYALSGDIYIAYQVTGNGPVDVVWAPGTVSHLDLDWDLPIRAQFLERFSSFCRLIRFDKRGTGLSDRPLKVATLEERSDDIRAVMDAAGSQQAVIFGASEGASMACLFAATYPERTRLLMIWGGQARWVKSDDYPWGLTLEEDDRMIQDVQAHWPSLEWLLGPGAGLGKEVDPVFLDWMLRYCRAAASPSAAAAYERMNAQIDIRAILTTIRVPTLVMNRTGDPVANIKAARDLASRISGARFVEFPGATHSMYTIEPERVLAEMEEFVTGVRSTGITNRILATVLFVDIVSSTERAAQLGDAGWRDLRDAYYVLVRKEIARFRGREMDTSGDGYFATFDGPARAIHCAIAIADAVKQLSIEIRAGLHTGECELMGDKLGGIAVHIGSRVLSKAGPGKVVVSSTVKDLVAGSGIEFEDKGFHVLKGVPGKWHLYIAKR
jgi:pimeloyl-ACP methyl ester carboxylesterase